MKFYFALFYTIFIHIILPKEQLAQVSESLPLKGPPELDAILLECPTFKEPRPCETQLLVNIRVSPSPNVEATDKFFILDEVYDPLKRIRVKIVSPYLIEVSRGEPVIMYPLQFTKTINVNRNRYNYPDQVKQTVSKNIGGNIETSNNNKEMHDNSEDYSMKDFTKERPSNSGKVHFRPSKKVRIDIKLKQRLQSLKNRNVRSNIDITRDVPIFESFKSNQCNHNNNNNKMTNQEKTSQLQNLARLGLVQYVTKSPAVSYTTSESNEKYNETKSDLFNLFDLSDLPRRENHTDGNNNPFTIDVAVPLLSEIENKSLALHPNKSMLSIVNSDQFHHSKDIGKNNTLAAPALNSSKGSDAVSIDIRNDIKKEMDRLRRKYPSPYETNTDYDALHLNRKAPKLKSYYPQEKKHHDLKLKQPSYELEGLPHFKKKPLRKHFSELDGSDIELLTKSWQRKYPTKRFKINRLARNRYNNMLAKKYNKNVEDTVYNYNPAEFVILPNLPLEMSHKIHKNNNFRRYDRHPKTKNYASRYEKPFTYTYDSDNSSMLFDVPFKSYKLPNHSMKRRSIAAYSPLSIKKRSESKKQLRNSKHKRSYLIYDDLDFQDSQKESDVDANNLAMNILPDNSEVMQKSDDIESCNSCDGKNIKPPLRKPECFNQKCPENVRDEIEDASCDSCGGKNKKPPPPEKQGCFNQKCSSNIPENVRDETEDASCDSCGGKNKKPPPPEKQGCFNQKCSSNIPENVRDETEDASCDSCGGKNKKPPPPEKQGCFNQKCSSNIPENVRDESEDASCDSCGGKNKKPPPPEKSGCFMQNCDNNNAMPVDDDASCDSCGGKNKKQPPKKSGCLSQNEHGSCLETDCSINAIPEINLKSVKEGLTKMFSVRKKKPHPKKLYNFDARLEVPEEVPCDSCGGKNTKPAPKKTSSFFQHNDAKTNPMPEKNHEEYIDVPCSSCGRNGKSGGKPVRDSFGNICNCLNDPASCRCESLKNPRSVNETYSVYNMSVPLPFLTTKIRVYRKRQQAWWRTIPEVTLNSLSGIFTNANLSVLFSSHVDILQLEKSLCFQQQTLLVPSQNKSSLVDKDSNSQTLLPLYNDPHKIFAFNPYASDISKLHEVDGIFSQEQASINEDFEVWDENQQQITRPRNYEPPKIGITPLSDLGYFPTSMNLLEQCPNDKNRLCLNMLDDQVPAFTIKMKMPFRENSIIKPNILKVKISRIVTDATTKDALQVSIDVINKGFQTHEFYISVSECPFSCLSSTKSSVRKVLMPYIGETVTFLLPLITKHKDRHKKIKCDVVVKSVLPHEQEALENCPPLSKKRSDDSKMIVVARREMEVEGQARCFCVWKCKCHCIPKLETHVNFDVCQKMSYNSEKEAGLLLNCPPGDEFEDVCLMESYRNEDSKDSGDFSDMLRKFISISIILLLLGLLKALLGLCSEAINRLCYDWVQPGGTYGCSSKTRRFFVNFLFFVMLPCMFCCKCFTPTQEDLMTADTQWECKGACNRPLSNDTDYNDEEIISTNKPKPKLKPKKSTSKTRRKSVSKRSSRISGGSDYTTNTSNSQSSRPSQEQMDLEEDYIDTDTEEDANNTFDIWQSLNKSKLALETLVCERTGVEKIQKTCGNRFQEVDYSKSFEFVQNLTSAGVVYRIFNQPVGDVNKIPPNCKYCIQGLFLSIDGAYQFINTLPLIQYICIADDGQTPELLKPVTYLKSVFFNRDYKTHQEVFQANDLSIMKPVDVPCINVMNVNTVTSSLIKLEEYQYKITGAGTSTARSTEHKDALKEKKDSIKCKKDSIKCNKDSITNNEDPIVRNARTINDNNQSSKENNGAIEEHKYLFERESK